MQKILYNMDGIQNDTEKIHIKKALGKIEGVKEIAIDRADSTIEVVFHEPATENEVRACIESTGHHVVD